MVLTPNGINLPDLNLRKMKKYFTLLLIALGLKLSAQSLSLAPTINSIGIKVTLPSGYDTDSTAHCFFKYKKVSETVWQDGFEADRIAPFSTDQYRGSIFLAEENTAYEVEVSLVDSVPVLNVQTLPVATVTTLSSPQFINNANVKWVSPSGSGTQYTSSNPGNLATLLSSGQVTCGTTVMLEDGTYNTFGLSLSINTNCTENTPIQFFAAPGAHPIFDGGVSTPLVWTEHVSIPDLYSAAIPPAAAYSNICLLGNKALYPYPTLTADPLFGNFNLVQLNFGYDGFVRDNNVIWIKTQSGINPVDSVITLSNQWRLLTVYGNNHDAYLQFKGLTIKNIGKPDISNGYPLGAVAIDLRKVNHVTFDSCDFAFNSSHIACTGTCNNLIVQHCSFKHEEGKFSHIMIKTSHNYLLFTPTSIGRDVENSAIFVDTSSGLIVRYNLFDGLNSGVESYFTTGFNQEADIYENTLVDNFDAIECDGNWSNLRVWKNEIIRPMAGFSTAPPLYGPRYFYRNLIYGMEGRHNDPTDHCYWSCAPVGTNCRSVGVGIKTNSGYAGGNAGNMYFINNTFYANDSLGFFFASPESNQWRKLMFVNNIFAQGIIQTANFHDLATSTDFSLYSQNDDYFVYDASAPLLTFDCTSQNNPANFQSAFQTLTGSTDVFFISPFHLNPQFNLIGPGGFELNAGSPVIDQGVVVNGFYDFNLLPDLGAKESQNPLIANENPNAVSFNVFPVPASNLLNVQLSNFIPGASISIYSITGQLLFEENINAGNFSVNINDLANGMYLLQINSGESAVGRKLFVKEQ